MSVLKGFQQRATKILEHLSRETGNGEPWKEEAQGHFVNVCKHLKAKCKALCSGGT